MTEQWKLEALAEDPLMRLWVYRMRQVGMGRLQSTIVTFVDGEVVLSGDLAPGDGYCCSSEYGKGHDPRWFAGDFGLEGKKPYLCGKFLHKAFVEESAREDLRDALERPDDYDLTDEQLADIRDEIDHPRGFDCSCEWIEFFREVGLYDLGDDPPGWDYNPNHRRMLIDIQARFAHLWHARMDELYGWADMGLWTGAKVEALMAKDTWVDCYVLGHWTTDGWADHVVVAGGELATTFGSEPSRVDRSRLRWPEKVAS